LQESHADFGVRILPALNGLRTAQFGYYKNTTNMILKAVA
jgi:hypothetical protein